MLRIPHRTSFIFRLQITAFLACFFVLSPSIEAAQETQSTGDIFENSDTQKHLIKPIIDTIEISGNHLVSKSAILAKIPFAKGDRFDKQKTGAIIKDIYQLGYFTNIKIFTKDLGEESVAVHIEVIEKPRIKNMTFEGNEHYESSKLYKALEGSRIRALDEAELVNIGEQIKKAYQEKQYHHVEVTGLFKPDTDGTQIAHFVVTEGKKSAVKKISFKGNNHLTDGQLRGKIFTHENWLFGFLDRSGLYHPDAILQDRYTIENFYQSNGYLTARVTDTKVDEHEDGNIDVTFTIEEGDLYTLSKVSAEGNELLDENALLARIPLYPGQLYSKDLIRSTMEILRTTWGEFGYIYADVQPSVRPDEKTKTVEVSFTTDLGNRISVDTIDVVGNYRTLDKVIRREILFNEGDMLTKHFMDESKRRVQLLGYFDTKDGVNWRIIKKNDHEANLELLVKEQSTGKFEAQVGWGMQADMSTPSGSFQASASAREINFMGTGVKWNLAAMYSRQNQTVDASIGNDWLFDRPISGSMDIFLRDVLYEDYHQTIEYPHERTKGANLNLGFRIPRFNFLAANLSLGHETISYRHPNIARTVYRDNPDMQKALQEQTNCIFQPGRLLWTGFTFSQDFRNNPFFPSSGFNWLWDLRVGLPGFSVSDFGFAKTTLNINWYTPVIEEKDIIFHIRGFVGLIHSLRNRNIPYRELFHIGGPMSVRGFLFGQIGPQLLGSSLGATRAFFVNAEMQIPITPDSNMRGYLFYDGGAGWQTYCTGSIPQNLLSNNSFEYRHAVGFGISLDHPTSIRVDWGFKLDRKRRRGETASEVHISASRAF